MQIGVCTRRGAVIKLPLNLTLTRGKYSVKCKTIIADKEEQQTRVNQQRQKNCFNFNRPIGPPRTIVILEPRHQNGVRETSPAPKGPSGNKYNQRIAACTWKHHFYSSVIDRIISRLRMFMQIRLLTDSQSLESDKRSLHSSSADINWVTETTRDEKSAALFTATSLK